MKESFTAKLRLRNKNKALIKVSKTLKEVNELLSFE